MTQAQSPFSPRDEGEFLGKMPLQSVAGQRIFPLRKFTFSTEKGEKQGRVFALLFARAKSNNFRRQAEPAIAIQKTKDEKFLKKNNSAITLAKQK